MKYLDLHFDIKLPHPNIKNSKLLCTVPSAPITRGTINDIIGCLGEHYVVPFGALQLEQALGIPDVLGGMQTLAVVGTTQILQIKTGVSIIKPHD